VREKEGEGQEKKEKERNERSRRRGREEGGENEDALDVHTRGNRKSMTQQAWI
jgi:hypothetical protein